MPSPLRTTASTGLSSGAPTAARDSAVATSSAVVDAAGNEEGDERVDVRVGEHDRRDLLVGSSRGRAEHVHRIGDARLGRQKLGQPGASGFGEIRELEAGSVRRVGGQDPEPACVRDEADAPAARHRLGGQERGDVRELLEGSARITPAWRKSASTAASEPARAAVCELAARAPAELVRS